MSPGESGRGFLFPLDPPAEIKFEMSKFSALFPSLIGTNLFAEVLKTVFAGGLLDCDRLCEDAAGVVGFGGFT